MNLVNAYFQPADDHGYRYSRLIATGGIGSGMVFRLESNHTLGRNESRPGELMPYKDYCKLHIITHYITVLLGAAGENAIQVYPIGRVGNDGIGPSLVRQMEETGMFVKYISIDEDSRTLFSVCFQYPDGSGGNITTSNGASSKVGPIDIRTFFEQASWDGSRDVVLAAPEVPVAARIQMLRFGRERGSFNVAAILTSEAEVFLESGGFCDVDLLSLNMDEASAIVRAGGEFVSRDEVVRQCTDIVTAINPAIKLIVTDGSNGSYGYEDGRLEYTPANKVEAAATAGAGDAFLGGLIAGICCGLPLLKGREDVWFGATPVESAIEVGTLVASMSVMSPDAIHLGVDVFSLHAFVQQCGTSLSPRVLRMFEQSSR